jgi:hypothetical protein
MEALVDNDILLKTACYGLFDELLSKNFSSADQIGILGAARFVVTKLLRKRALRGDREEAVKRLNEFIECIVIVEPTTEEQIMAADFELAAQRAGVALDTGESQLCAILITRALQQLFTGDKRAIQAIKELLDSDTRLHFLCGKVQCLEQMILRAVSENNVQLFRAAVCAEPEVDKTLAICFSCNRADASLETIREGLNSYINDLRTRAPEILAS